ncbi:hypothetical protein [Algibacter lectus]|uniref:hypothetical protein n=1 Tax=Algibacter lectus TaxID=221126 RepID=UPI0026F15EB7|nr:hypothetical protein [Algibacter lectus]MDO7138199.1 hypothetical protein [Algibacter lectus]
MKNSLSIIILVLSFNFLYAQKPYKFPLNESLKGKCFLKCFEYDKIFEWKEVDCDEFSVKLESNAAISSQNEEERVIEKERAKLKLISYQEKLKGLGYKVEVSGIVDDATLIAHDKFLRKKIREEKRNKKVKKTS